MAVTCTGRVIFPGRLLIQLWEKAAGSSSTWRRPSSAKSSSPLCSPRAAPDDSAVSEGLQQIGDSLSQDLVQSSVRPSALAWLGLGLAAPGKGRARDGVGVGVVQPWKRENHRPVRHKGAALH